MGSLDDDEMVLLVFQGIYTKEHSREVRAPEHALLGHTHLQIWKNSQRSKGLSTHRIFVTVTDNYLINGCSSHSNCLIGFTSSCNKS